MSHPNIAFLNDEAFALLDKGDKQGAKAIFEQVCAIDATDAESRMMLGVILAENGDLKNSENYLRQALALDDKYSDVYYYLCNVLRAKGKESEALKCLERSVELDPDFANAKEILSSLHMKLANTLLQQNNLEEAAVYFEKMTQYQPGLAASWFMLGRTRGQQGQYTEAERCIRESISIDPSLVEAHFILASFLLMQGRTEEACKHCDKAIELDPENINAIAMAANIAKRMGDSEKSYNLLEPFIEKGVEQINIALAFSMVSKDVGRQKEAINLLESLLESETVSNHATQGNLHFNLGMLYDDIKEYDKAFSHYQQGNALKGITFDQQKNTQLIDKHIAVYNESFMASMPRSLMLSDRPVFIVGMVRSGTSLIEQILSSHPDVFGAGELADIYQITNKLPEVLQTDVAYPECLSLLTQEYVNSLSQKYIDHLTQISSNAKRVTDKLPANFMSLGLIELLFPDARIIHCMRDPVDTCLSTYFQDFPSIHPYAYDLENLAAYYQDYLKMMEHWRNVIKLPLLEVQYEDLIVNQEGVSRSLVEFCDLEWHDDCLQFHKNKRFVRTASYDQVNRPLYNRSVARWKKYEKHLQPLLTVLS